MPNAKELKEHIESIRDTQKITNAMYLIASNKLRRAKTDLDRTRPYFTALREEIKRIFRISSDAENQYFYPVDETQLITGTYGYLIITSEKGLAGGYNQNVFKETERLLEAHPEKAGARLFVLGECGKQYYRSRNISIEEDFPYSSQSPTLHTARHICERLLEKYRSGELAKIYVVYTDMQKGFGNVRSARLLPFHRAQFSSEDDLSGSHFEFLPSVSDVLDHIVPSYLSGFVYSALVDSFCSELNARMLAMDAAGRSAKELLNTLTVQYNHVRQGVITQEITEISAGSRGQKKKAASAEGRVKR